MHNFHGIILNVWQEMSFGFRGVGVPNLLMLLRLAARVDEYLRHRRIGDGQGDLGKGFAMIGGRFDIAKPTQNHSPRPHINQQTPFYQRRRCVAFLK